MVACFVILARCVAVAVSFGEVLNAHVVMVLLVIVIVVWSFWAPHVMAVIVAFSALAFLVTCVTAFLLMVHIHHVFSGELHLFSSDLTISVRDRAIIMLKYWQ